jgi:hypothetical protein
MRTKQFTIAALIVCLFSILTNDALAFYNPETGHWLTRDPIEENGGVNLYATACNDFINGIDLLGCVKIRFEVVRGINIGWLNGSWLGEWGSPAKFASGSYLIDDFSADSLVNIESPLAGSDYGGSCNTVWGKGEDKHAGEIKAFVSDLCPGTYKITIDYTVHLWADANKSEKAGPIVDIYNTSNDNNTVIWRGQGTATHPIWTEQKAIIIVKVKSKSEEVMVANYVPTLEGPNSKQHRVLHAYGRLILSKEQIQEVSK